MSGLFCPDCDGVGRLAPVYGGGSALGHACRLCHGTGRCNLVEAIGESPKRYALRCPRCGTPTDEHDGCSAMIVKCVANLRLLVEGPDADRLMAVLDKGDATMSGAKDHVGRCGGCGRCEP